MRFPHHTKIFRGHLDVAAFVGVFLLLAMFLLLHSSLVFTPGVLIQLPEAANVPGTESPTISVAVDHDGVCYFENQVISQSHLRTKLQQAVERARGPLTLVLLADKETRYEVIVRLGLLARAAGVSQMLQATRPPPVPTATSSRP